MSITLDELTIDHLAARLRECWVLRSNLRISAPRPGWCDAPLWHAIVIESVRVDREYRRQGRFKRFLAEVCADPRFELVIVEGVQNDHLYDALMRWGWSFNETVMDFYRFQDAQS